MSSKCAIEGCGKNVLARRLCSQHYSRWYRNGDPLTVTLAPRGSTATFVRWLLSEAHVLPPTCILWPKPCPYPQARIDGQQVAVHRYICRAVNGPKPSPKHEVAHTCGRGEEGCVHPKHVIWATHAENMSHTVIHGTSLRGERTNFAKLNEAAVLAIRSTDEPADVVATRYNVSAHTIRTVRRRLTWRHLP